MGGLTSGIVSVFDTSSDSLVGTFNVGYGGAANAGDARSFAVGGIVQSDARQRQCGYAELPETPGSGAIHRSDYFGKRAAQLSGAEVLAPYVPVPTSPVLTAVRAADPTESSTREFTITVHEHMAKPPSRHKPPIIPVTG